MDLTDPTGNVVLDMMAPEDRASLSPYLTTISVAKGEVLIRQFDIVETVHFPVSADLSNSLIFFDGRAVEATSVGRDGLSGLAAFLADAPIAWEVMVQTPGEVLAISADVLRRRVRASPDLLDLLLRVTHENQSQAAQTVACNTLHDTTQRLARWLLMVSDRTGRTVLELTQEGMAAQLGAQRTTINGAAQTLKRGRGVDFSRGLIVIRDRSALEAFACECYRAQRDRTSRFGLALPEPR